LKKKCTEHGTRNQRAVVRGMVDIEELSGVAQVVSSYVWKEGGIYKINLLVMKKKMKKKCTEHGTRDQRAVIRGMVDTEERRGVVQVVSSYDWKEGGNYEINLLVKKKKPKKKPKNVPNTARVISVPSSGV
jgi:tetrahydromethanopterin S-methyltransferase subunit A